MFISAYFLLQGSVSSNGEAVADVQFLLYPQEGIKVASVCIVRNAHFSKNLIFVAFFFKLMYLHNCHEMVKPLPEGTGI